MRGCILSSRNKKIAMKRKSCALIVRDNAKPQATTAINALIILVLNARTKLQAIIKKLLKIFESMTVRSKLYRQNIVKTVITSFKTVTLFARLANRLIITIGFVVIAVITTVITTPDHTCSKLLLISILTGLEDWNWGHRLI